MSREEYVLFENNESYQEPCFASFLRSLGCCLAYACLPCCGCCCPYQTIDKGNRGVILEFGRVKRDVSEGFHYVNPITEKLEVLNMKIQLIDLAKQNVMTSDKLSINIDSVVYYKITNVNDALFKIDNIQNSIKELAHTTLRNVIGNSTLETCLSQRDEIAKSIKEIVDRAVHEWGVEIISIQIKDIIVPQNIITSLSSAVTAEREAQAKIITAKADVEAAKLMREASDILASDAAMQIRSLEVIEKIAQSQNKVFVIPHELGLNFNKNFVVDKINK